MKSVSTIEIFRKSSPFVALLDQNSGPLEYPKAEKIQEICQSIWSKKGKRLRPHLVYWFGELCNVAPEKLKIYAWAAEAIHTATLLHDDVIDQAVMRRGGPSANQTYDNTLPVIAGDYLLSDVLHQISLLDDRENLILLTQVLKDLCSGECLQYETKFTIPESSGVFFNIAKLKTSSLFRWCALVAPNISKSSLTQEIDDFMTSFGLLFQYTDDFLDIFGNSGKENWNDLKEGKLNLVTWPMILKNASLYQTIVDDFSKKIVSEKLLISFDMVSKNKLVLKQARDNIQFVADQTLQALNKLPNSKIKLSLKDLVSICIDRTK